MIRAALIAGLWLVSGAAVAAKAKPPSPNKIYDRDCSVCHQANGAGMAGAFPKLSGRAAALAALASGRDLLVSTILYGMAGKLETDGHAILGVMPGFAPLKDAEVAAVLNFLASLGAGNAKKFTAKEVAAIRARPPLTPTQVNQMARDPALQAAQQ